MKLMNGEHLCWEEDDNSLSEVSESDPEMLETSPVEKIIINVLITVILIQN